MFEFSCPGDFQKLWTFRTFHLNAYHYTDARRRGITTHYIGTMLRGHARLTDGENDITVSEGDFFYIPKYCRYQSFWYGEPEIVFGSYGFVCFPEEAEAEYPLQAFPAAPQVRALCAKIETNTGVPSSASVGAFSQMLAQCLPLMRTKESREPDERLSAARAYMEAHPDFRVSEIAAQCSLSESSVYALFRRELHCTPVEEKHRILVKRAVTLLTTTDLSVEEISTRLGFGTAGYFRRILREQTGQTPREIRRASRRI